MPLTTLVAGNTARASHVNANFALCVLTDTAKTITVTHTWTASQTFTGGFTTGASSTLGGHLLFTDATYDIGASGATRPRDGYFSRNMVLGGTLAVTGVATLTAQPILSSLTASQAVFTDGSKGLVSVAVTGTGNVVRSADATLTGTVTAATLNATTLGGTLSTAAQPNVTSVGTLTSLAMSGALSGATTITATGGFLASGGGVYTGGDVGFTATGASLNVGLYSLSVTSPTMLFDHRAASNTGLWLWRNGTGGANTRMTLDASGVLTVAGGLTVSTGTTAVQALTATTASIGGGNVATAGTVRFADGQSIQWRNSANSGNIALTVSDTMTWGSSLAITGALSGVTTLTATGLIQTTLTTQQLSLRYDASNHLAVTVSSAGAVTYNATGASASHTFSDQVTISGDLSVSQSLLAGSLGAVTLSLSGGANQLLFATGSASLVDGAVWFDGTNLRLRSGGLSLTIQAS